VLLLGTTPPRDERPDAVTMRMTRRTYEDMLRSAFSAVAGIEQAELIVRPHPRAPDDPTVWRLCVELPHLRVKVVRRGRLAARLRRVDCVLSCGSTAGVEAAAAGLPVIQLVPHGVVDFPQAERFGMLGTASTEPELRRLLDEVLSGTRQPACPRAPHPVAAPTALLAARIAAGVIDAITPFPAKGVTATQVCTTPPFHHSTTPTLQHSAAPPP
jgi:hypothetical protein